MIFLKEENYTLYLVRNTGIKHIIKRDLDAGIRFWKLFLARPLGWPQKIENSVIAGK